MESAQSRTSHENHPEVKSHILSRSIAEDQKVVAEQWAKTFLHNPKDDVATEIMRLMMACVAAGNFMVKNALSDKFERPSDVLTIADYLSHGSRIMIDTSQLSDPKEVQQYFAGKNVFARPSTHDFIRQDGRLKERKVLVRAALEMLPSFVVTPNNHGVNIAMGGEGLHDFYGNVIHADGHCGHVYYYRDDTLKGIMCGLEQSAPAKTYMQMGAQLVLGAGCDQFGQTHSTSGASDIYTAAGSLYFSDPVYAAKLAVEHYIVPPAKYDGMLVTLTDENWPQVKAYLDRIRNADNQSNMEALLLDKPSTHEKKEKIDSSYIQLDFKQYMERIFDMWIENNPELAKDKAEIKRCHEAFMQNIEKLNYPDELYVKRLHDLFNHIKKTLPVNSELILNYLKAVEYIIKLYELEKERVKEFGNLELILRNRYLIGRNEVIQSTIVEMIEKANAIIAFYSATFVDQDDDGIKDYIRLLQDKIGQLQNYRDPENAASDDLYASIVMMDAGNGSVNEQTLNEAGRVIEEAHQLFASCPKLQSDVVVKARLRQLEDQHAALDERQVRLRNELMALAATHKKQLDIANDKLADTQSRLDEEVRANKELVIRLEEAQKVQQNREDAEVRDIPHASDVEAVNLVPERTINPAPQSGASVARIIQVAEVSIAIKELRQISATLKEKEFTRAASEADELAEILESAVGTYVNNPANTLENFKTSCLNAINKDYQELYNVPEAKIWKRNLKNCLLGFALLGVGYAIAISVNRVRNGNWLFFSDSSYQLADNRRSINKALKADALNPKPNV